MRLDPPADKKSRVERLGYWYAMREVLRREHNRRGVELTAADFAEWKRNYFRPLNLAISQEINRLRDVEVTPAEKDAVDPAEFLVGEGKGRKIKRPAKHARWDDWLASLCIAARKLPRGRADRLLIETEYNAVKQSPPQAEVDAVVLPTAPMDGEELADPQEDLTTWTTFGLCSVNANGGWWTGSADWTYSGCFKDGGAAHFGNLTHDGRVKLATPVLSACSWLVTDVPGASIYHMENTNSAGIGIYAYEYYDSGWKYGLVLENFGDDAGDSCAGLSVGSWFYHVATRSGASAQVEAYTDEAKLSLWDTLSTAAAAAAFQYVYALASIDRNTLASGGDGSEIAGWVDLHEAVAGQPFAKRFGGVPYAAMNRGVW